MHRGGHHHVPLVTRRRIHLTRPPEMPHAPTGHNHQRTQACTPA